MHQHAVQKIGFLILKKFKHVTMAPSLSYSIYGANVVGSKGRFILLLMHSLYNMFFETCEW